MDSRARETAETFELLKASWKRCTTDDEVEQDCSRPIASEARLGSVTRSVGFGECLGTYANSLSRSNGCEGAETIATMVFVGSGVESTDWRDETRGLHRIMGMSASKSLERTVREMGKLLSENEGRGERNSSNSAGAANC